MASSIFAGLIEFLENECDAREVEVGYGVPADMAEVITWERHQKCTLPEDLRQFYLTTNGVSLYWSYLYSNALVHLGTVHVNSLKDLCPLHIEQDATASKKGSPSQPSLLDLDVITHTKVEKEGGWMPSFGGSCKIFALDFSSVSGHICLVYNTKDKDSGCGMWLLDLSLSWHYICPTFSDFLRLTVIHLGLLQWPYALTSYGVSPHFEKWFHMFIPKRLELDRQHVLLQLSPTSGAAYIDLLKVKNTDEGMGLKPSTSIFKNHLDISKVLYSSALKDKKQQASSLPPISSRKSQPK